MARIRPSRAVGSALVAFVLFVPAAQGAVRGEPAPTWVPNGRVDAIAVSGSTAYLGGNFSRVAPYTGGSVRLDAGTAEQQGPWPEVHGSGGLDPAVQTVAADGVGGYYLGGHFSSVGGVARSNLAHVLADGTVDLAWAPTADDDVRVLITRPGAGGAAATVYAGGRFSYVNGELRRSIVALTPDTGALSGPAIGVFRSNGATGGPYNGAQALALDTTGADPVLYVGGGFDRATTTIGFQTRNGAAAFNTRTGGLTAFDPDVYPVTGDGVLSLVRSGARVFLGGSFSKIGGSGGMTRNTLASVNAQTGAVGAWDPNRPCCQVSVRSLAVAGETVYAGGENDNGLTDHKAFEAYDRTTGALLPWAPPAKRSGATVRQLKVVGTTVYAGGTFTSADNAPERQNLAAYDATTGAATSWAPTAAGPVAGLAVVGASVVAGGAFETYGGVARRNLAAIDLDTGRPTAFDAPLDGSFAKNQEVLSLVLSGGELWAGGSFRTTAASSQANLAAFDPVTGAQTSLRASAGNNVGGHVYALVSDGTTVFAGGDFISIGQVERNQIAAIRHRVSDPGGGTILRFNPDVRSLGASYVKSLALSGNTLYFGGRFATVNAVADRANLAAVDTELGYVLPWNPGADADVQALATDGTTVFAGGDFLTAGGADRPHLAAFDASSGAVRPFAPAPDKPVRALALHAGTLFAGGDFTTIGAPSGSSAAFAALDPGTGALAGPPLPIVANPNSGKVPLTEDQYQPTDPDITAIAADPVAGLLTGGRFLQNDTAVRSIHFAAAALPPLAPSGVTGTAGVRSVTVGFTPPPSPRGAPVTAYSLTASPGGQTRSAAGGPVTFTGLSGTTAYTFTATATNAVGTSTPSAPSPPVTPLAEPVAGAGSGVGAPPVPIAKDTTEPRLLAFGVSRAKLRVGKSTTPLSGTAARATPRGTTVRMTLSERATVRIEVLRVSTGRRVGRTCRKTSKTNAQRAKCALLTLRATLTRTAPAGASRFAFTGRISRKPLPAGSYVLRATPRDAAGNIGAARTVTLKVVRR